MANKLTDNFGRTINYLRLSVTDRCDFRCIYCMTEEMQFVPRSQVLSIEELVFIAKAFVSLGTTKIRLTGGEPLIRRGILNLIHQLRNISQLRELTITTNGSQLSQMASDLQQAGIDRINISLDSLRPERFRKMTRTGCLSTVLEGLEAAATAGFKRIKINSVILRGVNDDEVTELVHLARELGADISFIEEMPLGNITDHDRSISQYSSDEARAVISSKWPLTPCSDTTGGPSRYYRFADHGSKVGFISPNSHNFCSDCNRVRLTAEGRLLLCLGNEHSSDLRSIVRKYPQDLSRMHRAIIEAMAIKPERHHFDYKETTPQLVRLMNMTGG